MLSSAMLSSTTLLCFHIAFCNESILVVSLAASTGWISLPSESRYTLSPTAKAVESGSGILFFFFLDAGAPGLATMAHDMATSNRTAMV